MKREPGHFGHGADFEPKGQISGGEPNLGGGLGEQGAGLSEFVDGGDHREEHSDWMRHPGSDERAELLFEHRRPVEAEP